MISFILFFLLLIFVVVIMYRLFTLNSTDRNIVFDKITNGQTNDTAQEETNKPNQNEEPQKENEESKAPGSSLLGFDNLMKSMWYGLDDLNRTYLTNHPKTRDTAKINVNNGSRGDFGNVIRSTESKGIRRNIDKNENRQEFGTDHDNEEVKGDSDYKQLPITKENLEIKPFEMNYGNDNTKEVSLEETKDDLKTKLKKSTDLIKSNKSTDVINLNNESKILPKKSIEDLQITAEKIKNKSYALNNTNELADEKTTHGELKDEKKQKTESTKSRHLLKSNHHKNHKRKSSHTKSSLKTKQLDLNTLLASHEQKKN